jgi:hypothetical protein
VLERTRLPLALVEELALTVQRLLWEACCLSLVDTSVSVLVVTVQARLALAVSALRVRLLVLTDMRHSLVAMVRAQLFTATLPASTRAVAVVVGTTVLLTLTLVALVVAVVTLALVALTLVVVALVALRLLVEQRVVRV